MEEAALLGFSKALKASAGEDSIARDNDLTTKAQVIIRKPKVRRKVPPKEPKPMCFLEESDSASHDPVENSPDSVSIDDCTSAGNTVPTIIVDNAVVRSDVAGDTNVVATGVAATGNSIVTLPRPLRNGNNLLRSMGRKVIMTNLVKKGSSLKGSAPKKGGIWPTPFPGYKGLFTYEVSEETRASDKSLGNGVYLWSLEILPTTVRIEESEEGSSDDPVTFGCIMKKTLVSLPDDACYAFQQTKDKYIIEEWSGQAEVNEKVFVLRTIGDTPVETTINFDGLPLPREALAGEFEMELSEDDSVIKAIHVSWMNFAKISADEASGFMFRMKQSSRVCPTLKPALETELDRKLKEAAKLLHGSKVQNSKEVRHVRYWPTIFRVNDISTTSGTFDAELEIAIDYLVSRDDVFEYIIRPNGWQPRWRPKTFETINAYDLDSVYVSVNQPSLQVLEGKEGREIRAEILVAYRGTFVERFELHSFPFDVQPLHVKLHVEQDQDVVMDKHTPPEYQGDLVGHLGDRLEKKWSNSEWYFLDLDLKHAKGTKENHGETCRLFVSARVQRHARSYLTRITGVIMMLCLLTCCIFVIDVTDALQDMMGHSFMMLLTMTTYSLVVGDILPNLGYLTVLDYIVLSSFVFLAVVVAEITYLGKRLAEDEEAEVLHDLTRTFSYLNLLALFSIGGGFSFYVHFFVLTKERRRTTEDPQLMLFELGLDSIAGSCSDLGASSSDLGAEDYRRRTVRGSQIATALADG